MVWRPTAASRSSPPSSLSNLTGRSPKWPPRYSPTPLRETAAAFPFPISGDAPGLGRGACRSGDGLRIGAGAPQLRRPAASPSMGWRNVLEMRPASGAERVALATASGSALARLSGGGPPPLQVWDGATFWRGARPRARRVWQTHRCRDCGSVLAMRLALGFGLPEVTAVWRGGRWRRGLEPDHRYGRRPGPRSGRPPRRGRPRRWRR